MGKDGVALASLSKLFYPAGRVRFIRSLFVLVSVKLFPKGVSTTGLYDVYRPCWMQAESEVILKSLKNPNRGGEFSYGEDTHLFDSIKKMHRIVALRDIGCYCLSDQIEDIPHVQFQTGRRFRFEAARFLSVLKWSVINMRPLVLKGYFYQKRKT